VSTSPRVRFAPSPTGLFHVGSARTALFNWLFARQQGGSFLLRIEDTDEERNREEWVEGICEAMRWLGLGWDEGPYRQSERLDRYREAAERLREQGFAYYCDCTREQLEARGRGQLGYDGFCRDRGLGPGPGRALRFRVPDGGTTTVRDLIRGDAVFRNETIEDFVLAKSTGAPLFVLANVVDDLDMGITHVIRGEEHLPTTPKYLLVREALGGGPPPVFAHLGLLVNERRQKLSKRRDPVAVEQYRAEGYLAPAMVNYLALLGWGPEDGREVLSVDELVAEFRLERVNPSPAFFDPKKLAHFNGLYLRRMPLQEFVEACRPWLARGPWPPERFDEQAFRTLAPLVQERASTLGEVPAWVAFAFLPEPAMDEASWQAAIAKDPELAAAALEGAAAAYATCPFEPAALHEATRQVAERLGRPLAKVQAPIRVAVTGRTVGLPLFESLAVLGRERVLARIAAARSRLEAPVG
jgi:glutamyl-tRNA synthetase